jgi:HD-GYP domain-containing protein (c-di-GMP phosphodiesterase class II)
MGQQLHTMTTKQIGIDQLRPGMFVVKTNVAWYVSPFVLFQRVIHGPDDVDRLRRAGVKDLVIDTKRGLDVYDPVAHRRRERARVAPMDLVREIRTDVMTVIRDAYKQAGEDKAIDLAPLSVAIDEAQYWLDSRLDAYLDHMHQRRKVPSVVAHAYAVLILSLAFMRMQPMSGASLPMLVQAALFHDVGWAKLPSALYGKRSAYTDAERALVYKHPQQGAAVLMRTPGVLPGVADITMQHHERGNGAGYPFGLKQTNLHALTPLIALIASYDDAVHGLSDQMPKPPALVLRKLAAEAAEGMWPVSLVENFTRMVGTYPINSAVRLNTGESGLVVNNSREFPLQPTIKLLYDARSRPLAEPAVLDLAKQAETAKRYIQDVLDPAVADVDPDRLLVINEV